MKKKTENQQVGVRANSAPTAVDEYIAAVAEPARTSLTEMRAAIRSCLPREATETISYKMPAFRLKQVLVWFAAFKDHCSLFPTAAVMEAFKDELAGYSTSKGTVRFPIGKPLPIALIKRLVKARLEQVQNKKQG